MAHSEHREDQSSVFALLPMAILIGKGTWVLGLLRLSFFSSRSILCSSPRWKGGIRDRSRLLR